MTRAERDRTTAAEAPSSASPVVEADAAQPDVAASRRPPTALEAKALAHVLRQRILRLCAYQELTNKELADQLDSDPGTVLYHVRLLLKAGLLEQAPVRTGVSGALEKPYRSTGRTWWLDNPLADASPDLRYAPVHATLEEVRADPDSVATFATFLLHLSEDDVKELDRRLLEVVDSFVRTDSERLDRPAHRGAFVVHRLPERGPSD